jgi:hypothetical protein
MRLQVCFLITVPLLMIVAGCESGSGPAGPQGQPGVPCSGCVDAASLGAGAVGDAAIASTGITTRTKLPSAVVYEDEANVFTQNQVVDAALEVRGDLFTYGLHQVDGGAPAPYALSALRLVADATPAMVGQVIPLDVALVDQLCADEDGCTVLMQMRTFNGTQEVASRKNHLFVSSDGRWRFADDTAGGDGNATTNDWINWDCYFTDAENMTNTSNGRADTVKGFGLLNVKGGGYSDTTTVCRLVLED